MILRSILTATFWLFLGLSASAANRFAVCTAACTWDGSSTAMWSTSTGGATGASVPGSSDAVILDAATCVGGVTCTVTVNTTVTVQSITMGVCTASTTGCILDFSANNNNVTLTANTGLNYSGSGVRNLKMGSGSWTFTGAGTGLISGTVNTNLTLSAASAPLIFSAATASIRGINTTGSPSFGSLTINANSSGGAFFPSLNGNATTFSSASIAAPNYIVFSPSITTTITGSIAVSGSTISSTVGFASSGIGTTATVSSATSSTLTFSTIRDLTFTGGGTFAATSSIDSGHNSGIAITAPVTGGGGFIFGGWLLERDLNSANDNLPVGINAVA